MTRANFTNIAIDEVGNRKTQTVEGVVTRYQYDAPNRLTRVNEQAYTWDDNGNLLNDGTRSFSYDAANRLTQVTQGGYTTTYAYNAQGDRTSQTVNGVTTTYVLDGGQVIVATTGGQSQHYLTGLAQYQASTWTYQLSDGLGSVQQLSDASGAIVLGQSYDPFGKVIEIQGDETTPFGYLGHLVDPLHGLIYVNGRYYDPLTGRFLTADPRMPNPYVPLSGTWWIVFPMIGGLVVAWRGRKEGTWRVLIMLWVMSLGMLVTSCGGGGDPTVTPLPPAPTLHVFRPPTGTSTPSNPLLSITPGGVSGQLSTFTPTPTSTPTLPPTVTPCPTPSSVILETFKLTMYTYALENDPNFAHEDRTKAAFDASGNLLGYYRPSFLARETSGVAMQGTGRTEDGTYIQYVSGWPDNPVYAPGQGGRYATSEPWKTVATGDPRLQPGDVIRLIDLTDSRLAGEFTVTDTGHGVGANHIDIFIGEIFLNDVYYLTPLIQGGSRIEIIRSISGN